MIKRADDVFHAVQVYRGFAADGGIHLRKNGRRDVIEVDAAHVTCGCEAGKIACNAAADRNDAVLPCKAALQHTRKQPFKRCKGFACLPLRDRDDFRSKALPCNGVGIGLRYTVVCHDENAALQIYELICLR